MDMTLIAYCREFQCARLAAKVERGSRKNSLHPREVREALEENREEESAEEVWREEKLLSMPRVL